MRTQFEALAHPFWGVENWLDEVTAPFREGRAGQVFTPACDLEETENSYLVSLDMPGVARENIKIEVVKDELVITAERPQEKGETKGLHLKERGHGTFYRAFTLDSAVNAEKIEALYKDGVLQITVPKAEAVRPKLIEVKSLN